METMSGWGEDTGIIWREKYWSTVEFDWQMPEIEIRPRQ
jgi:hypothetical protein